MSALHQDPGWLDWYREPVRARASRCPPGRWTRTATSSAPAPSSPSRRSASTRRATRARTSSSRSATTSASAATSSSRPPATARTTARWWTRSQSAGGRARGVATVRPGRHRRRTAPRWTRPACGACGSTSSSGWSTPPRRTTWPTIAQEDRAAGLACRRLLRGRGPGGAGGLLRLAAHARWWWTTWAGRTSPSPSDGPRVQPVPAVRRARTMCG